MVYKHTAILIFLLVSFGVSAQTQYRITGYKDVNLEKNRKLLDSLYLSGFEGYKSGYWNEYVFPNTALKDNVQGIVIIEFSINAQGQVSARFMTKLDDSIQQSLEHFVIEASEQWLFYGKPYKFYQPVVFNLGDYVIGGLVEAVEEFPKAFGAPFLIPFDIALVKGSTSRIRIGSNNSIQSQTTNLGFLYHPPAVAKSFDYGSTMDRYNRELERYQKFLDKGKLRKALKSLSLVIRYNPFDIDLLQQRVRLEKQLGSNDFRMYDVPWISVLMELTGSF